MEKQVHMKKSTKVLFTSIVMLIIFGIVTMIFFYKNFLPATTSITYNEKSNINYSVCLKNNQYFDNNCITEKRTFVADIIDYINIDFSYLINSSVILNQDYSYNITSEVIATSKEDESKVLYDKTTTLVDNKETKTNKENQANMVESLKINYKDYSDTITNFKKDYILALDAKLIVTMNINYNGSYSDEFSNISKAKKLTIEIPLSEQTVSITTNVDNENLTNTIYKKADNNQILKIILTILITFDIIIVLTVVISIYKLKPYKKEYLKKLDKILKEYDRAIVTTKTMPEVRDKSIIEIGSFEEMLDARDNLEKPILFYQSKKEDCSIFTIINGDEAYVYALKANYNEK